MKLMIDIEGKGREDLINSLIEIRSQITDGYTSGTNGKQNAHFTYVITPSTPPESE